MSSPRPARSRKAGILIAVAATNILPIAGVLFLGWKAFHIALLYWFEVFIIGVTEVLANLVHNPDPDATRESGSTSSKPRTAPHERFTGGD